MLLNSKVCKNFKWIIPKKSALVWAVDKFIGRPKSK